MSSDPPVTPPEAPEPSPAVDAANPPGKALRLEAARRQREEEALARLKREVQEVEDYRMPLMEHLVELKNRLLYAIAAIFLGTLVGFYFAREIFEFLQAPFVESTGQKLVLVQSPFEGIFTWFRVAVVAGLLIASPVVSYQAWAFVAPGLYKSERRVVIPLSMSSVFLFFLGAGFCYYAIFPYAFPFFVDVLELEAFISADGYLQAVTRMMLAFGLCFQLPIGSWFLARMGFVDHKDMIAGFRYAVVVIFVVAALITPPDPLTQTMLAVPMCLLYAIGIFIAYFATTKVREPEAPATSAT